jgi:4-diphosphocytidyl-2-C-methyl-D-erythritol kinase
MLCLESRAKINWYLRVKDKRPDGFHEIETIFQEIALADRMTFEAIASNCCEIEGMPFELPAEQNLIWRAWNCLRERFPAKVAGVRVVIEKRIPACGGLGGASSNAATTLRALNALYELRLSTNELEKIAALLGSDVAFFIRGGCAIGRGRGELLEAIDGVPSYAIMLAFPNTKVPTAEAYRRLSSRARPAPRASLTEVVAALRSGDPTRLAPMIHNDFEILVAEEPWFLEASAALRDSGCIRTFLSGSGSTVVGLKNTLEHGISSHRSEKYVNPSWVRETRTCSQPHSVGA